MWFYRIMHRNNKFNKDGIVYSFFFISNKSTANPPGTYIKNSLVSFPECVLTECCILFKENYCKQPISNPNYPNGFLLFSFCFFCKLHINYFFISTWTEIDRICDLFVVFPLQEHLLWRLITSLYQFRQQSVTQLITFSEPFLELTRSTGNRIGVSKDGAIIFTFSVLLKLRIDRLHNRALLNTISWRGYLHYCHLFNIHVSPYTLPALNPSLERHPTKHQSWYGRLVRKRYSNISNDTFPDTANPWHTHRTDVLQ